MTVENGNPYQGTPEWLAERCGYMTASNAYKVLSRTKAGKPLADYEKYCNQLIAERLTGLTTEVFYSKEMQWGTDHEDEARQTYALLTNPMQIETTGFIKHPAIEFLGASPDGLVDDDGLVEIKCPNTSTHIERLRSGEIPEMYRFQMAIQLICTGRKWCDFVDFDPRIENPKAKIMIKRFTLDDKERADIETKCLEFLQKVKDEYDRVCQNDTENDTNDTENDTEDEIIAF